MSLRYLPLLFVFLFAQLSHAEVLGRMEVEVSVSNRGQTQFAFAIPKKNSTTVVDYLKLGIFDTKVEIIEKHILRLHFPDPIIISLADNDSNLIVARRFFRQLDILLGEEEMRTVRLLFRSLEMAVVTLPGFREKRHVFLRQIEEQGLETAAESRDFPEVFRFSHLSLEMTLEQLSASGPVAPDLISASYHRVINSVGDVTPEIYSRFDMQIETILPFNSTTVSELLQKTAQAEKYLEQKSRQRSLERRTENRQKPGKVIPFPGTCKKLFDDK